MNVQTLAVGEFQANCHIVWGESEQAIVIDPGADPSRILCVLDSKQLTVAAYLLTHGHMDHCSALADLVDARPAPVGIHPAETEWAFSPANRWPPFYDTPRRPANVERLLADEQEWSDGGLTYRVIATPGHSPGSLCLFFPNTPALFTGDTLFAGSVGRTDLPGGDGRELRRSLLRLAALPDSTAVYTGHGPETTIGEEKRHNYFLQAARHIR